MDFCSFCQGKLFAFRDVHNNIDLNVVAICGTCYKEVNKMMNLMNKDQKDDAAATNWGTKNAVKWIEEAKKREEDCVRLVGILAVTFREGSYSDIQVKPGNGPSIPAHRFLLATSSEVFKTMLASDMCKSAPVDSVSLPEFNHEELEAFLEFLYCGKVSREKFDKHFCSLALAADKYVIPHLHSYCEHHILKLLNPSNALKIMEVAEACSNEVLKAAALRSVLSNAKEIYFSPAYVEFSRRNPDLMVYITRAHIENQM
ncbi:hypothetical protein MKW94_009211 [Papaver nudicaule]|uniref:BTB domain-containing protein n=1 Tax=Papaver nudicaule TaxID=74823 RepID=A0AA41S662_PAPNU|nr:hypothetical protein [Papaver nudicaule]